MRRLVLALSLLARQAQWSIDHARDERSLAATRRFAAQTPLRFEPLNLEDARQLAREEP